MISTDEEVSAEPYVYFLKSSLMGHVDIVWDMFYKTTPIGNDTFVRALADFWLAGEDAAKSMNSSQEEIFFNKIFQKMVDNRLNIRLVNGDFFIVGDHFRDIEETKAKLIKYGFFSGIELEAMIPKCMLTFTFDYPDDIDNLEDALLNQFKIDDVKLYLFSSRAREMEILIDYLNSLSTPKETFMLDGRFQDKLEETDNRVYLQVENLLIKLEKYFSKQRHRNKSNKSKDSVFSPEYDALKQLCESLGSGRQFMTLGDTKTSGIRGINNKKLKKIRNQLRKTLNNPGKRVPQTKSR